MRSVSGRQLFRRGRPRSRRRLAPNFTVDGRKTRKGRRPSSPSGSFFDTLGRPGGLIGRTFSEADDRRGGGPDGPRVAVISYGFWQRQVFSAAGGRHRPHRHSRERAVHDRRRHAAGFLRAPTSAATFDVIVPLGHGAARSARSESRLSDPGPDLVEHHCPAEAGPVAGTRQPRC